MLRYGLTIFLGAMLLFLVQPLMAKYILPWFGGGSGVWTVCLMFFQVVLLAGYAYAYALVRWAPPKAQMCIHIVLLIGAVLTLPIAPGAVWKPEAGDDPTWRIVALLAVCLGGPYLLLASTGPLLQAWFVRTHPGRSPYRLYALSNAGSLLGLLGYPMAFEPFLTRSSQSWAWSISFVVYALLGAWCAVRQRSAPRLHDAGLAASTAPSTTSAVRTIGVADILLWLLPPACSSAMLLAVTSHITEDIAPVPMLWVLPLALYLLTFIVCFEWPRVYVRGVWAALFVGGMGLAAWQSGKPNPGLVELVGGQLLILTSLCMICHGELYRRRPDPRRLTSYYLAIAAGGALGGAFVSLIAPVLFNTRLEYDIALHGGAVLLLVCVLVDPKSGLRLHTRWAAAWLVFIAIWIVVISVNLNAWVQRYRLSVENMRNFYGAMSLLLIGGENPPTMHFRLVHGRIAHGGQYANPQYRKWPTTYFGLESGIGRLLTLLSDHPRRVAVLGLGVGTLAVYGRPDDIFRFYEINPQITKAAVENFTYLEESPARIEVIPGDGRLSMERELERDGPQNYDVIILDAFSGDSVPIHLLTKEAFETYLQHLAPRGVIAVNISNRYVDLTRVMAGLAEEFNLELSILLNAHDLPKLVMASKWVLLSRDLEVLAQPGIREGAKEPVPGGPPPIVWTDEYASLLPVMQWTGIAVPRRSDPVPTTQPQ